MSSPEVLGFAYDDENEDKLHEHGLTSAQIDQILGNTHWCVPNRKKGEHRASHLIIGVDNGGTCLTIPIERTHDPEIWRPITGWRSTEEEQARLDKGGRRKVL